MTKKKTTKGWFGKLFDMDDNTVSASTVFLIITSVTATILLLVPAAVLLIEVIATHTITTNLSGMAAYIASVCGLYASGGILKGWTNYSRYRYNSGSQEKAITSEADDAKEEDLSDEMKGKIADVVSSVLKNVTGKRETVEENGDDMEIDA